MIVYLLFNEVTEKCYVVQTIESLRTRWRKHKSQAIHGRPTRIGKAIRKYGKDSFYLQTLCEATSKQSLDNLERVWVVLLQSTNENFGYNITSGGNTAIATEEGTARMIQKLTGRKLTEIHKRNIGQASRLRWSDPAYKSRLSEKFKNATRRNSHAC